MGSKMNAGQKRVSKQIREFCKKHAYMAQFDFKLFPLDLRNDTGRIALCESGIVTIYVGAIIDNWRDFPTRTLQRFLDAAKRLVAEKEPKVETPKVAAKPKFVTSWGTPNFVSKTAAIRYYKTQECDTAEVNRKIKDGEIEIGYPKVPEGMTLWIDHEEGRYMLADTGNKSGKA